LASVANDVAKGVEGDVASKPPELPEPSLEVGARAFSASSVKDVGESGKGGVENSSFAGSLGGTVGKRPPE